jgi:hypothetical protein
MAFTFRDRIKIACLARCIDAGLNTDQMVDAFRKATRCVQTGKIKSANAGWLRPTAQGLGYLALLGIPASAFASAALGNIAGNTVKNVEVGRLPTTEEIKLLDEIATYHRTADEVKRRTEENEKQKKLNTKPSVRRLF